jgi:hypothetical protein
LEADFRCTLKAAFEPIDSDKPSQIRHREAENRVCCCPIDRSIQASGDGPIEVKADHKINMECRAMSSATCCASSC